MRLTKIWSADVHRGLLHDAEDEFVTLPDVAAWNSLGSCHLPSLYTLLVCLTEARNSSLSAIDPSMAPLEQFNSWLFVDSAMTDNLTQPNVLEFM